MKKYFYVIIFLVSSFFSLQTKAQRISIDAAGIRNHSRQLHGTNISVFYHFTEMLSAGVEVNRFFTRHSMKESEPVTLSAWDYDFNLHYYIPLQQKLYIYPVAGISYSVEKEQAKEIKREKNFYVNSGAGLLLNFQTVKPHIEYIYAFGAKNESFFISGVTIELNLKKRKN
jgi:hypothetical protein